MAQHDRLKALYVAQEHLQDARTALLSTTASSAMKDLARTVTVLVRGVRAQIAIEEAQIDQEEQGT